MATGVLPGSPGHAATASPFPDPDDEPFLRLAEASGGRLVTTHNLRDLRQSAAASHHGLAPVQISAHDPHTAMTTLHAIIPADIHKAVLAQAGRERISVEALVSRTLRAAIALPLPGLTVPQHADRANWEDFDRIMARVPDAPPVPGDERDAQ
jgi:hypothetical protein